MMGVCPPVMLSLGLFILIFCLLCFLLLGSTLGLFFFFFFKPVFIEV